MRSIAGHEDVARHRGVLVAFASAFAYGLTTPVTAVLARRLGTWQLAAALYLGAAVLLVRRSGPIVAGERRWLAASALVGGVVAPGLLVVGLRLADAATASLALASQTVFTAAIAWVVAREHVSRRTAAGMAALALAGLVLAWRGSPHGAGGTLLILGAALAWAIDDNLARRLERSDTLAVAGWKGLAAGVTSLLLAFLLGEGLPGPAFAAGLAVGAIGYGLSVAWFVSAQRDLGTARTAAYFGTAPVIGALAALAAGARPNPPAFAAALVLTAVGVWLHLGEQHDHEHRHGDLVHAHPHTPDREHRHAHP